MSTSDTPTRVYLVLPTAGGDPRLVRAAHRAAALRHAAASAFSVRIAGQDDLIGQLASGVAIEVAGVEPAGA